MYKLLFYAASIIRILKTPMLEFLPQLKLHHVVVLKENSSMYAIDFTPINQTSFQTMKKLFLGHSVPAEIRIVPIYNASFHDEKSLIKEWEKSIVREKRIYIEGWNNETMNLYEHNCQHFSRFIMKKISHDKDYDQ